MTDSCKQSRVYGLDVVRAFAILFVLMGHSFSHSKLSPLVHAYGSLAVLGVELFFVLSGFLIGTIIVKLIDEKRFHSLPDIYAFWKRRWIRTLPLYFIALLAYLRFDYHGRHGLLDYPLYFVFMQNFAYKIPEFFELSWSLAIEEHFYFWFPLVFLLWARITQHKHAAVSLAAVTFIAIAYIYRLSNPLITDWTEFDRLIRLPVLSRIDALMFGILIATIKKDFHNIFIGIRKLTPIWATLFVLSSVWWCSSTPFLMTSRVIQLHVFTVQSLLCALLLPWFDSLRTSEERGGFFVVTSKLSYSLYLGHIIVIIGINKALAKFGVYDQIYSNPFLLYPIYFSCFYLFAWITYHCIEEPFLRLRDVEFSWLSSMRASWTGVSIAFILVFIA